MIIKSDSCAGIRNQSYSVNKLKSLILSLTDIFSPVAGAWVGLQTRLLAVALICGWLIQRTWISIGLSYLLNSNLRCVYITYSCVRLFTYVNAPLNTSMQPEYAVHPYLFLFAYASVSTDLYKHSSVSFYLRVCVCSAQAIIFPASLTTSLTAPCWPLQQRQRS